MGNHGKTIGKTIGKGDLPSGKRIVTVIKNYGLNHHAIDSMGKLHSVNWAMFNRELLNYQRV